VRADKSNPLTQGHAINALPGMTGIPVRISAVHRSASVDKRSALRLGEFN
jgi:hypothetical protein